jgi:hypothetical protein
MPVRLAALLLTLTFAAAAHAQSKVHSDRLKKLFDPETIGIEAKLQGEYRGELNGLLQNLACDTVTAFPISGVRKK